MPRFCCGQMIAMPPAQSPRRLTALARIVRSRPRLFSAATLGLIIVLASPASFRMSTRLLIGWDIGIGYYLVAVYVIAVRSGVAEIRRNSALQDEGRLTLLALTVCAALASLAAIVAEMGAAHRTSGSPGWGPLVLATSTIALSWGFIHTIFALHYAHEFYSERQGRGGGLKFPGGGDPDYWDFVYFSFVIGMTSQVSDVSITHKGIRRTVAVHGVVAFAFNAALVALTVNIAASVI